MSFGGNQNTPVSHIISNDGFYPDLDVAVFRQEYNIEERHSQKTVERIVVASIVKINQALATQKTLWLEAGYSALEQTQSESIGGMNLAHWHYQHAVFHQAKADFIDVLIGTSRQEPGANLAQDAEELKTTHLKESAESIAALNGGYGAFRAALL